ncbi:response regulator [Pseudomonas fluorescens ABAC62]|nr:response regulator [Pseudomonas fluorescens ABAC62]
MPKYPLRILLVEDHPFQLLAAQYLLKSFGFEHLSPAENAEHAIRLMKQAEAPFDIILCDQCLPDLPGLELIEIAHRLGVVRFAILLSGLPEAELSTLQDQALKRGLPILGYLPKPLNKAGLVGLIQPLLTL